jgi:hypothetical protein
LTRFGGHLETGPLGPREGVHVGREDQTSVNALFGHASHDLSSDVLDLVGRVNRLIESGFRGHRPRGVQKLDRHVTSAWRSGLRQCGAMICSLLYLLLRRVLGLVHSEDRAAAEADIELAVLRHQVAILRRQVKRPIYRASDRAFLAAASRILRRDSWSAFLVRPETLLRWHRQLVRRKWTRPHRPRGPGADPPTGEGEPQVGLHADSRRTRWSTPARFVDEPTLAVAEADALVLTVMRQRGYPMDDFDQRAADVSVDHPEVVENYRAAHAISDRVKADRATTEDMRQALVHYRALFDELLEERGTRMREAR